LSIDWRYFHKYTVKMGTCWNLPTIMYYFTYGVLFYLFMIYVTTFSFVKIIVCRVEL
jgi:hypothetical protein